MFKILFIIISIFSSVYATYFLVMACGLFKKDDKKILDKKINKFAILIAARNEEGVIGNLIDSLKKQNYPSDKYEIIVIVNNCTDNTLEVSKKHGASIIECNEKVKSKGEVLKYTFNKLDKRKDIDAYVIFDADNLVHEDFLQKMNDMINRGYALAQGFRDTKNVSDNWLSSSYALLYYMQSLFINKARYNLGKSSFLNGTGFMVKKEVIDKHGFNPVTLTEDIEFTAICAVNDEKIAFCEDAITYDEQVSSFRDSLKQRKRWSFGTVQCLKNYFWPLLKKGLKEGKLECFDIILFYLSVVLHVVTAISSLSYSIYLFFTIKNFTISSLMFVISPFVGYIIGVIFRLFVIKKVNKSVKENIGGILLFDLFLISWIPINFICLFKKDVSWDQIKHNRNISVNDLNM